MTIILLDSSALLASIFQEHGCDKVNEVLDQSAITSVNLAEVVQRLARNGVTEEDIQFMLRKLDIPVIDFTVSMMAILTNLAVKTVNTRLSLGDRGFFMGDRPCTAHHLQRLVS